MMQEIYHTVATTCTHCRTQSEYTDLVTSRTASFSPMYGISAPEVDFVAFNKLRTEANISVSVIADKIYVYIGRCDCVSTLRRNGKFQGVVSSIYVTLEKGILEKCCL